MNVIAGSFPDGIPEAVATHLGGTRDQLPEGSKNVLVSGSDIVSFLDDGDFQIAVIGNLTHAPGRTVEVTDSPSALLLDRYKSLGEAFLDGVRGQFALILNAKDFLLAATDPSGLRSLFAATTGDNIVVSSNLMAAASGSKMTVDRQYEDFFLIHGFYPLQHTVFENVVALPSGTTVRWSSTDCVERKIASEEAEFDLEAASPETVMDELYRRFLNVIEEQSNGVDHVGVLLGGFDSALVAAGLARIGKEVETYSFYFEENIYNQPHTDLVAEHLNIRHHWVEVTSDDLVDGYRRFPDVFNMPTNWPGYVLQTELCCQRMFDDGIRFAYSGDGCDSVFLGYPGTYRRSQLFGADRSIPTWVLDSATTILDQPFLDRVVGQPYRSGMGFLRSLSRDGPSRVYLSFRIFDETSLRALRLDNPPQGHTYAELADLVSAPHAGLSSVRLAYAGKGAVSPNKSKMVGSADSTGVIVQSPYLHPSIKGFAASFPDEWSRPEDERSMADTGKVVLQNMAERHDLLPQSVIHQPKHAAVDSPVDAWYAGRMRSAMVDLFEELPFPYDRGYVNSLLGTTWTERQFKERFAADRVISHGASLLATYAAFAGRAHA